MGAFEFVLKIMQVPMWEIKFKKMKKFLKREEYI